MTEQRRAQFRSFAAFSVLTHGVFAGFLLLCGCEKSEQITTYSVPKHESLLSAKFRGPRQHASRNGRLQLSPRDDVLWFFKLQGNDKTVSARENDVRELLKSVRFPDTNIIDWTLPAKWRQLPASEMRYATLVMDGEPPLEMSVSQLPARPGMPISEQLEDNINRWRNQLSLPTIEPGDLNGMTEQLLASGRLLDQHLRTSKPKPKAMAGPQHPAGPQHLVEPTNRSNRMRRIRTNDAISQTNLSTKLLRLG